MLSTDTFKIGNRTRKQTVVQVKGNAVLLRIEDIIADNGIKQIIWAVYSGASKHAATAASRKAALVALDRKA